MNLGTILLNRLVLAMVHNKIVVKWYFNISRYCPQYCWSCWELLRAILTSMQVLLLGEGRAACKQVWYGDVAMAGGVQRWPISAV